MNLSHTVRDLRNFINACVPFSPFPPCARISPTRTHSARPENLTRPYTIATTFPTRVLDPVQDDPKTIEEAGLKNSVVVQRWA